MTRLFDFMHRNIGFALFTTAWLGGIVFLSLHLTNVFSWHGDGGLYLQHAKNLYEHKPYDYLIEGQIFAPGYPLLLALWGWLISWDLSSLKLIATFSLSVTSFLTYRLARREFSETVAALMGVAVLCAPSLAQHRQIINSDLTYMAFAFAALFLWGRAEEIGSTRPFLFYGFGGLLFAVMGWLTRPAGLPLILAGALPSLIALFRRKGQRNIHARLVFFAGIAASMTIYILLSQRFSGQFLEFAYAAVRNLYEADGVSGIVTRYFDRIPAEGQNFYDALSFWPRTGLSDLDAVIVPMFQHPIALIVTVSFVFWGFIRRIQQRGWDSFNWFVVLYILQILITPWTSGIRYFLPLIPISIIFLGYSFSDLDSALARSRVRVFRLGLILLSGAVLYYGARTYQIRWQGDVVLNAATLDPALEFLASHTSEDERICSFLSNNTMYLIQRRTCGLNTGVQARLVAGGALWAIDQQVKYILVPLHADISPPHAGLAQKLLMDKSFTVAYRNADYVIVEPIKP